MENLRFVDVTRRMKKSEKKPKHVPEELCKFTFAFFTLGCFFFIIEEKERKKVKVIKLILPFKEVCVFGLSDKTGSHHNSLEALSLDRP